MSDSSDLFELFQLFEELSELPERERPAFLDERATSSTLRSKLERMLERMNDASLGARRLPPIDAGSTLPEKIGSYTVRGELGSGGMGVVYLAEQDKPRRQVAIKVMRSGLVSQALLRRFELEGEFLGRLQHPGIAQVYESGVAGEGPRRQMYLAMEFIEGEPITKYAEARELGQADRIDLLIQVCEALHHAHVRGVVHRDVKPSNVLVTQDGRAKVIDFGVARALDREANGTLQTQTGEIVGTLAYMSPEQVNGEIDQVDTRSDVYALGVLAYELLSGQLPIDTTGKHISTAVHMVVTREPKRLGSVSPELRGDLEWIVAQAIEKEAGRRYQSSGEFAADLRRAINHEPVEARPSSAIYQIGKIARRHKVAVTGIAATVLAILVGGGFAVHFGIQNADLAELERKERERADERTDEAVRLAAAERIAREEADRNAADLRLVADFLGSRLSAISSYSLGVGIRDSIEEELRRSRPKSKPRSEPDAEPDAGESSREVEILLDGVNMTNVAVSTMDAAMFQPMRRELDETFANRPELMVKMLASHARLLAAKGLLAKSSQAYRDVLAFGETLPEDTPDLLRARLFLSVDQGRDARWEDVKSGLAEVLDRARSVLGENDIDVVNATGALARAEHRMGNYTDAERLYVDQIERLKPIVEQRRDEQVLNDALISYNNYGSLLYDAGRAAEARPIVEAMYKLIDSEDPSHARLKIHALGLDALTLMATGAIEAGERVSREAVALSSRVHGDFAETTSLQRRILIDHLERVGSYTGLDELLKTESKAQRQRHGENSFNYMLSQLKLSNALFELQKIEEARACAAAGLVLAEANLGEEHRFTRAMAQMLGAACHKLIDSGVGGEVEATLSDLKLRYSDVVK